MFIEIRVRVIQKSTGIPMGSVAEEGLGPGEVAAGRGHAGADVAIGGGKGVGRGIVE